MTGSRHCGRRRRHGEWGAGHLVIDELPWLIEQDAAIEGSLQAVWDRDLSHLPILLVLIGTDAAVMNALQAPSRAFHLPGGGAHAG